MRIPTQLNNYSLWYEGYRFIGMTTVTLPNLANLTDELKSAGYGGTTTYPVQSHYGDWAVVFNFTAPSRDSIKLMAQDGLMVQAMSGTQEHETGEHKILIGAWTYTLGIIPRGFDLGALEVGVKQNVAIEAACTYIKAVYNGETMFEKDKPNMKDVILGVDYARNIRRAIGMTG
jgi:P2 family phage contractile tail tube protein